MAALSHAVFLPEQIQDYLIGQMPLLAKLPSVIAKNVLEMTHFRNLMKGPNKEKNGYEKFLL